jgi:hypothetical protein
VTPRALLAGVALLAGCTTGSEPCAGVATCVRLDVDGLAVHTIDQLELDLVYAGHHATTTVGTAGDPMDLPFSIPLTLDLPDPPLIEIAAIAAGRLNGSVLALAAGTATVQQGHHTSLDLLLSAAHGCTEGELYCGGTIDVLGDGESLYRCTRQVPIFYTRCSAGCFSHYSDHAVCVGNGLCRDGGTYCGGHVLDGDPGTLYVCESFHGTAPRPCPRSCVVRGDGVDACE